jgi:hypothetical protein
VTAAYGWFGPSGLTHVEFDHRVPFSLCGGNDAANIWPEPADGLRQTAYTHNHKDQLEAKVSSMVRYGQLTLAAGQRMFLDDWRVSWCQLIHTPEIVCDI